MKKITLLIVFLFFVSQGFTQNNGGSKSSNSQDMIEKVTLEMCECVDAFFKDMHPKMKEFMLKAAKEGEKASEVWFEKEMEKLSSEEQGQIMGDLIKLGGIETYLDENCSKIFENEKIKKDESFKNKMIEYLSKNKDCELTYHFFLLGTQQEEENTDDY